MKAILMLIPVALTLGAIGLVAFLWSLRTGQFEDLDGAANRILFDYDQPEAPAASQASDVQASDVEASDANGAEAGNTHKETPPTNRQG